MLKQLILTIGLLTFSISLFADHDCGENLNLESRSKISKADIIGKWYSKPKNSRKKDEEPVITFWPSGEADFFEDKFRFEIRGQRVLLKSLKANKVEVCIFRNDSKFYLSTREMERIYHESEIADMISELPPDSQDYARAHEEIKGKYRGTLNDAIIENFYSDAVKFKSGSPKGIYISFEAHAKKNWRSPLSMQLTPLTKYVWPISFIITEVKVTPDNFNKMELDHIYPERAFKAGQKYKIEFWFTPAFVGGIKSVSGVKDPKERINGIPFEWGECLIPKAGINNDSHGKNRLEVSLQELGRDYQFEWPYSTDGRIASQKMNLPSLKEIYRAYQEAKIPECMRVGPGNWWVHPKNKRYVEAYLKEQNK